MLFFFSKRKKKTCKKICCGTGNRFLGSILTKLMDSNPVAASSSKLNFLEVSGTSTDLRHEDVIVWPRLGWPCGTIRKITEWGPGSNPTASSESLCDFSASQLAFLCLSSSVCKMGAVNSHIPEAPFQLRVKDALMLTWAAAARGPHPEDPAQGLTLCRHHLKITSNIWTRGRGFSFMPGPAGYIASLDGSTQQLSHVFSAQTPPSQQPHCNNSLTVRCRHWNVFNQESRNSVPDSRKELPSI